MPRGPVLASPPEQQNTLDNILKDFREGRARVYRGIPAIRVFAKDAKNIPTGDYPYYEHPQYGDEIVSIITYTGIEEFLKKKLGERRPGPIRKNTSTPSQQVLEFEWETVYVDMHLTPHEWNAFNTGDAHNASNLFRSLARVISFEDETGEVTIYRGNIHDAIVAYGYEPIGVDHGVTRVDIWPSGSNQGRYLADLDELFLLTAMKRGSAIAANEHTQNLGSIARAELSRREGVKKAEADEKSTKKGASK